MRHLINSKGITGSISTITKNVCDKNGFYLDVLENGEYLISKQDLPIGIFSDAECALCYFMSKTDPQPELTETEKFNLIQSISKQTSIESS